MDWPTTSREVLAELDRLDLLVADLLLFARADEHGLKLHPSPVDLAGLVRDEAARHSRADGITVAASTVPVAAVIDRHAVERAVRNLTENAVRHARSHVQLSVTVDAGQVVIDVASTGRGAGIATRPDLRAFRAARREPGPRQRRDRPRPADRPPDRRRA